MSSNQLDQLKALTTVVVDSGDINAVARYQPEDATTNPSLVLKAIEQPEYNHLVAQAVAWAKEFAKDKPLVTATADKLAVMLGCEILKHIPGRVSTEVDAHLSFNTEATIAKALELVAMYEQAGVDKSRILIKIASTWEGIQAAKQLEQMGIQCNLTLLFGFAQAQACAEAGVFLISPFVGRILDWYKKDQPNADFTGLNDPGVVSVTKIYNFYKACGFQTVVMGASFRNVGELQSLAGCDRLTISPALLDELQNQTAPLVAQLIDKGVSEEKPAPLTEDSFRWAMNEDPMATEKLAEGIRNFAKDQVKLYRLIEKVTG
ncbi:transaldolase [Saccharophagus degradans]|uniref:transaldolase n=1 Tax=Saccharophagus degradans TaxID=86304 RepID=UPI001C092E8E|nr:transaldolase [Saccharophagus degradans]MBU2984827.1 transaldolase [Saccharophagus degradans]